LRKGLNEEEICGAAWFESVTGRAVGAAGEKHEHIVAAVAAPLVPRP
jgi:hypothetical protein